ncbi:hypothetical protein EII17_10790 [Clostridiales bacterium COT073_COT-073]|nr:hypothetical protein EII17_10790 [Clostridiales bacterium COT073_COT-073]
MQNGSKYRFQWQLSPIYEKSEMNPQVAFTKWGDKGPLLAAMEVEGKSRWEKDCLRDGQNRDQLLAKRQELITSGAAYPEIEKSWQEYCRQRRLAAVKDEVRQWVVAGTKNTYEQILKQAEPENLDWLADYQLPIAQAEIDMCKFWFAQPLARLRDMAGHIVAAFLHGFISQSRERGQRRRVRFYYQVGQEALAKEVVLAMQEKGLVPVITCPKSMFGRNQFAVDHQFDLYRQLSATEVTELITAYQETLAANAEELRDTCGMIGIDQFGQKPETIIPATHSLQLDSREMELFYQLQLEKMKAEAEYVKPSELSFCKITFPNLLLEEQFPELFEKFFALNLMDSTEYEWEQQKLIDAMDLCEKIEIKGIEGNQTDLTVQLFAIKDPVSQTKFLNCGGDLNIPFGEVFTTPKLKGTEGILHIPHICLKGVFYHNLFLQIKDGIILKADCDEGEDYIKKNLLQNREQVGFGEFAIGTNTYAATLTEQYQLDERLPILIYEKTGPHLAVGDSCFARAEDRPIYNMYDHKEMVCRENEAPYFNGPSRQYYGFHTDITLPYHQILYLRGRTKTGELIPIIENGRFVLAGIDKLNQGFAGIGDGRQVQ